MKKYYENFILCGEADFHCLVCTMTMHKEDLDRHIENDYHDDCKFLAVLLDEYKEDGIYQILIYYYCIFCNHIVKRSKIKRHISQDRHISNTKLTKIPTCKLYVEYKNEYVVVKNNYGMIKVLRKWEWHGIIKRKCLLCNITVDCNDKHISEHDHITRLIKTYVKNEKFLYRQINEKLFQCFDCMKIILNNDLLNHITTQEHDDNYLKHYVDTSKIYSQLEGNTNDEEIKDYGKIRAKLARYGRKHYIKLTARGVKGFCVLCAKFLSVQMSVFESHVKGSIHSSHLKLRLTNEPSIQPILDEDYEIMPFMKKVKSLVYLSDIEVFWMNKEYLIPKSNFMMWKEIELDKNNKKCLCLACGILFPCGKESAHCMTLEHKKSFFTSFVIFTMEPEDHIFREVKPNLFHCCSCNNLFPNWNTLSRVAYDCNSNYDVLNAKFNGYLGNMIEIKLSHSCDIFYLDVLRAVFGANIYLTLNYSHNENSKVLNLENYIREVIR
ncbi:hypothetical protein K1T71_013566 [Dendrolimus kikuchii]|uniref:Uncharacterized protein n=1 Tax=Dendrolimus kikuchii TaxID=765133 RepID=A0ACC1CGU6_9NEOP|nr:hypothetical protein K1T71_013566 [Dendrolimus kikuchii]